MTQPKSFIEQELEKLDGVGLNNNHTDNQFLSIIQKAREKLRKKRLRTSFSIEMRATQEFEGMKLDKNGEYVKWSDFEEIFGK